MQQLVELEHFSSYYSDPLLNKDLEILVIVECCGSDQRPLLP